MTDGPQFVIKATDKFALYIISAYRRFCMAHGMHEQAAEVAKAIDEIALWQKENPELVHLPDHRHVPFQPGEGSS
jgi:hypothetical protein